MAASVAFHLVVLACLGVFACAQTQDSIRAPGGVPAPTSAPALSSAPAPAVSLAAYSSATSDGYKQLANFLKTPPGNASALGGHAEALIDLSASAFLVPITFHPFPANMTSSQAAAPPAATAGRRLLQLTVDQTNNIDTTWTAAVDVQDGKGNFQTFTVRMDTGSSNYLIPLAVPPNVPGFIPNGLPESNPPQVFGFGGGSDNEGPEFSTTTRFSGLPATTTPRTNIFAVDLFVSPGHTIVPNPGPFPLGLGITSGIVINGVRQEPLIQTMFNQKVIPLPAFTVVFTEFNPVFSPATPQPGGIIALGTAIPLVPKLQNTDLQCAPVVPPPPGNTAVEWVVALQHVSASQNSPAPLGPNTFNFCSPTSGCSALIDSGTFDIALPPEFFPSLLQLLGLPANPPLVGFNITSRGLISADGYPQIACAARARSGPTIDFQIQDRVYSLAPADYIFQWNTSRTGKPLVPPVCAAVFQPSIPLHSPEPNGPPNFFILGDPFMAKFPETFFGPGIINAAVPRGVVPNVPRTPAEGKADGTEEDICFYGTVPVKAVCAPSPIVLPVTNPATCEADIAPDLLLNLVNFGNRVTAFLDAAGNPLPTSTVYTLQPLPTPKTYVFAGGQTETIELTATTPTFPVSVDSCLATVTVPLTPPKAVCKPTLTLPATSGCAAHPTAAELQAGVDAGSSQGSGGPLTVTLNPPAPPGGVYTLPVGSFPITLTVANCAGTSSCSTLVTVADQEALTKSKVSCGGLPSNGIVRGSLLSHSADPLTVFTPSYAKANGCPVALFTDNLSCKDCLLGSSLDTSHGHCDSQITSKGVAIGAKQLARVAWTVTATDQAGGEVTADCAVCVDQAGTSIGHCPDPFTPATPCQAGSL